MISCIFCDILAGEKPSKFIYRDDLCAAFMDIHPVNPGHVLVVPVKHAAMLADLDEQSVGHLLKVAQRVDVAIRSSGIHCDGVNLYLADGRPAGQEVMHVHLHVIPRFSEDGHHLRFSPNYFIRPSAEDLEKNAEFIRKKMGDW
jgi:histidine triad (HIT) family protein